MANRFVTADHHFFHANIITYCRRPFDNMRSMNEELEARWNAAIQPDDVVYHLGDFALADPKYAWDLGQLFKRLHGTKFLIKGSHDRGNLELPWKDIIYDHILLDGVLLIHDGEQYERRRTIERSNQLTFCGHVHAIWQVKANKLNVGVDTNHFRPWAWEDAAAYLAERFDYWRQHEAPRQF